MTTSHILTDEEREAVFMSATPDAVRVPKGWRDVTKAIEAALIAKLSERAVLPDAQHDAVEKEILNRYRVEETNGGFWPSCVKAGSGSMNVFVGSKKQADHVQQALQTACLDGAFMAVTQMREAFAQGAASQLSAEPVAQVSLCNLEANPEGTEWCREVLLYSPKNEGDKLRGINTRAKLYTRKEPT